MGLLKVFSSFIQSLPQGLIWFGALISLGGLLLLETRHAAQLEVRLDAAIAIANENAILAVQERKDRAEIAHIAARTRDQSERDRQKYTSKRREVLDAPHDDDGPIAPVLRHVLNGLPVTRNAPLNAASDH